MTPSLVRLSDSRSRRSSSWLQVSSEAGAAATSDRAAGGAPGGAASAEAFASAEGASNVREAPVAGSVWGGMS